MSSTTKPVAIVTGASSGIGLGIALALIEQGYGVVATSRTISKSKELTASADLVLIDGDIGKKETAVKVAEAAIQHFGRIDLLVNNAGIFIPKSFTDYTEDELLSGHEHQCGQFLLYDTASDPADEEAKFGSCRQHFCGPGGPTKRQRSCSSGCAFKVDHAGREQGFGLGIRRQRDPRKYRITGNHQYPDARRRRSRCVAEISSYS